MIDDGHYSIQSNPFFKVMGYDHGKYYVYSWLSGQALVFKHGKFTDKDLIELAPLEFWDTHFPGASGRFKRLDAVSAIIRVANSRGVFTW